ncbi:MAG: sulfotransferase domain-containing protein [Alphaproteobacteria bacterium]|nr:sulfotransferase domain-containing protein [Alphaproteobacteria bacterium]
MLARAPTAPVLKTRDIHNHHMDSTKWDTFKFRDDDIIIATYSKSGTTWMQQIVSQLIFDGAENIPVSKLSPWVDLRIMPPEVLAGVEQQTHRRFVKTHLPADALVFSPKAKYIYVGRDGRDMVWSMYNHYANANEHWYGALNNTPGRVGPAIEPPPPTAEEFFRQWFEQDGYPFWSYWENVRSWWALRGLPNVKFMHFNDMKRDLPGSIYEIAEFLGLPKQGKVFQDIVDHCTFAYMKAHAETVTPLGGALWEGGANTFIHKGTNGRWKDSLTKAEIAAYEQRAIKELGEECASWLANGGAAVK